MLGEEGACAFLTAGKAQTNAALQTIQRRKPATFHAVMQLENKDDSTASSLNDSQVHFTSRFTGVAQDHVIRANVCRTECRGGGTERRVLGRFTEKNHDTVDVGATSTC
jgi:hypothetical protein